MNQLNSHIKEISSKAALQAVFMVFMSFQISVGQLTEFIDHFQLSDIELTEEGDTEKEENKEKEEVEKNEFLDKIFFCAFSEQEKYQLHRKNTLNWSASLLEVPTPPPRAFAG